MSEQKVDAQRRRWVDECARHQDQQDQDDEQALRMAKLHRLEIAEAALRQAKRSFKEHGERALALGEASRQACKRVVGAHKNDFSRLQDQARVADSRSVQSQLDCERALYQVRLAAKKVSKMSDLSGAGSGQRTGHKRGAGTGSTGSAGSTGSTGSTGGTAKRVKPHIQGSRALVSTSLAGPAGDDKRRKCAASVASAASVADAAGVKPGQPTPPSRPSRLSGQAKVEAVKAVNRAVMTVGGRGMPSFRTADVADYLVQEGLAGWWTCRHAALKFIRKNLLQLVKQKIVTLHNSGKQGSDMRFALVAPATAPAKPASTLDQHTGASASKDVKAETVVAQIHRLLEQRAGAYAGSDVQAANVLEQIRLLLQPI